MSSAIKNHLNTTPHVWEEIANSVRQHQAAQEVEIRRQEAEYDRMIASAEENDRKIDDEIRLWQEQPLEQLLKKEPYRRYHPYTQAENQQKAKLFASVEIDNLKMQKNTWRISYDRNQRQLVRNRVKNDSKYWPEWWDNSGVDNMKAAFILCHPEFIQKNLKKDLLPPSFKEFFLSATRSANSFVKEKLNYAMEPLGWDPHQPQLALETIGTPFSTSELSPIFSSLTAEWQKIFKALNNSKKESEASAPSISQECLKYFPSEKRTYPRRYPWYFSLPSGRCAN